MQSPSPPIRERPSHVIERLLSDHERDQELVFIMGETGRISKEQFCQAAKELEQEAPCDYLKWLVQTRASKDDPRSKIEYGHLEDNKWPSQTWRQRSAAPPERPAGTT